MATDVLGLGKLWVCVSLVSSHIADEFCCTDLRTCSAKLETSGSGHWEFYFKKNNCHGAYVSHNAHIRQKLGLKNVSFCSCEQLPSDSLRGHFNKREEKQLRKKEEK